MYAWINYNLEVGPSLPILPLHETPAVHPSPCMELSLAHIVSGASLPHPVVRDTVGSLHIVDQVLYEVHLVHGEHHLCVCITR